MPREKKKTRDSRRCLCGNRLSDYGHFGDVCSYCWTQMTANENQFVTGTTCANPSSTSKGGP